MFPRLGVNIDHVATLRQARGEEYPSVVEAANVVLDSGADQITIHLREDRRHIQDTDVETIRLVTKKFGRPLNLEMGATQQIIDIAIATAPDWICLVPEHRQELTTEGGLNLSDGNVFDKIQDTVKKLRAGIEQVKISLFLEADVEIIKKACLIAPDAVEIHTGAYTRLFQNGDNYGNHLERFHETARRLKDNSIACHAGHGITIENIIPLLELKHFSEYNIGHWIICQSLYEGMGNVIKRLKEQFNKYSLS